MKWQNEVYLKLISSGIYRFCVCDCGEVLDDVIVHYTTNKNGIREFDYFSPNRCPSCGCTIRGVWIEEECLRGDSDGRDVDSKRTL